ncbi:MAG TPA: PfkB family carbohydrate kinase [Thermomicrobiales bacterium]|nr:PfkB family carbohydrate kinase [Thermomicrobiales bacterium]
MSGTVDLVRRFDGLRALVIGDAILDSYLRGTVARLCSEGPVPVVSKTGQESSPGGAANTAANLRALGAEVIYLGVVGADPAACTLRHALRERDVDDAWLVEDEAAETLHKLRILAGDQYVVRVDEGETRRASAGAEARLLAHVDDAFPLADVVVVSDYGYGAVSDVVIERLRALIAASPRLLVVDAKDVRRFHRSGATLIAPNHLEARMAVEPAVRPDPEVCLAEVERIGRRLLAMVDARYAAITLAAQGVLLLGRDGTADHLPTRPVVHADDVGAGDSFTAAAALALAAGGEPVDAVRIGIEAAGIAVTKPRTAVVPREDLLRRLGRGEDVVGPGVAALAARIDADRVAGRTVVFTNGVFDLLHAGHVQFLRMARELGDILVVGVNSDASVRRLKGKSRPINSERDRLALVAALDVVDHAILFEDDTPASLIRALRPHLHVKGGDYANTEIPEADAVREVGARSVILPRIGLASTTGVIDRVLATATNGSAPRSRARTGVVR